ncbi:hypothetical protein DSECCO2_449940 [anaerobic digester metagenome]
MKRVLLLSLIFSALSFFSAKAQNNVGIGTTSPAASALLDLTATDKGLLIPRVTLIAATNGTTPVASPATGLLVYNTGGAMTAGFYYWDGTQWVQVGAGGATGCTTLDEAYDCGGNGSGRSVTVDAGRVEFTIPSGATNNEGLYIVSNKGTSGTPTACSWLVQNQWGVGLQVDNNLGANEYSAVQGSTYTSQTSTTTFPAGIAGYASGTGKAVGVWAEYDGTNTGGAGLYAKSSGNNFAARMVGNAYPGAYIQTNSASSQAFQAASSGASYTNPCGLLVGSVQIDCSSATQHSVIFNNLSGDPTVAPSAGQWGYLGTNTVYWYYLYYQNAVAVSRRDLKRDIQPLDSDLYAYALDEIMKMKPSLYKFKNENDEMVSGLENKTRYNYHLGLILDEAPDFIQDNSFGGIDVYALSTLNLAGIQAVNAKLQEVPVTDFGTGAITATEVRINYSAVITGANISGTPIVNITPTSPNAKFYVKSQDLTGFVIVSENGPMTFNWTVNARKMVSEEQYNIPASVMSQLKVDESKKSLMRSFSSKPQQQPMQLLGPSDAKETNPRN